MAISVQSGFQIGNIDPVDARLSVADESARLGFASDNVYEGLTVYLPLELKTQQMVLFCQHQETIPMYIHFTMGLHLPIYQQLPELL